MKGSMLIPPVGGLSLAGSASCNLGLLSAVSLISDTSSVQGAISCALLEGADSNRLPLSLCVVVYRAYKCCTFFVIEFAENPCLADLAFTQCHLQEFPVGTQRQMEKAAHFGSPCSQLGSDFPEMYELTSLHLWPCRLPVQWLRQARFVCVPLALGGGSGNIFLELQLSAPRLPAGCFCWACSHMMVAVDVS